MAVLFAVDRMRLFQEEMRRFVELSQFSAPRFTIDPSDILPCLNDRTPSADFDHHYVYHTAWAARKLVAFRPAFHVDISSSLYFSSIVSAFMPVRVYDYRPAPLFLDNLQSSHADLLNLPFPDHSLRSVSCMHVVEHVGLGRYGDPLDPNGDLKAMSQLERVLAPGGRLLFVVPIGGRSRVVFNAHRIYRIEQIVEAFSRLRLEEFALIPDVPGRQGIVRNASAELASAQTYGCGCFCFERSA